jgi:septum formation protein
LCADSTVALGRRILGKPADAAEARAMLADLSGRAHKVHTAVAVGAARKTELRLSTSSVRFAPMPDAEIARYVASGEPMGKAGAYAVQGRAAAWIEHMAGSYSGIMGLPLHETTRLLRTFSIAMDVPAG